MTTTLTLISRISSPCNTLIEPGPTSTQLLEILQTATHCPDHGRLQPWRFVIIQNEQREKLGKLALEQLLIEQESASPIRIEKERTRFSFAPCIVAVVHSPKPHPKIPAIEQVLSGGAVCMNILHAAHQLGFGGQWLTGFSAYNKVVLNALGLKPEESILGFMHLGSKSQEPKDWERPDVTSLISEASL
jgi:nitroreductase